MLDLTGLSGLSGLPDQIRKLFGSHDWIFNVDYSKDLMLYGFACNFLLFWLGKLPFLEESLWRLSSYRIVCKAIARIWVVFWFSFWRQRTTWFLYVVVRKYFVLFLSGSFPTVSIDDWLKRGNRPLSPMAYFIQWKYAMSIVKAVIVRVSRCGRALSLSRYPFCWLSFDYLRFMSQE